jgi:hypothetical protein
MEQIAWIKISGNPHPSVVKLGAAMVGIKRALGQFVMQGNV